MEDNNEKIRVLVCQRIEEVQDAMKSLQNVRKTLVHKAYEVKQSILSSHVSKRDSIQQKEMSLLTEVDRQLHAKDDSLVTQLSKLSQVLGCLRNCLQSSHPCGDCLEKFEDIDMSCAQEVNMDFSAASEMLRDAAPFSLDPFPRAAADVNVHAEDEQMTRWLLTPTNNHTAELEVQQGRKELIATEWLFQHHPHTSAVNASSWFTKVKAEGKDDWLEDDRSAPNALYMYAVNLFAAIIAQDSHIWLEQRQGDAALHRTTSFSDSDSEASDITSSYGSSVVIVPGSTSSEDSGDKSGANSSYIYVDPKSTMYRGSVDGNGSSSIASATAEASSYRAPLQCEVREWVASCQSSEVINVPASYSHPAMHSMTSEWLNHSPSAITPSQHADLSFSYQPSNPWLVHEQPSTKEAMFSNSEWWLHSPQSVPQHSAKWTPYAITKSTSLKSEPSNEKSFSGSLVDNGEDWLASPYCKKGDHNSGEMWLAQGLRKQVTGSQPEKLSGSLSSIANDWLSGEEKHDEPEHMNSCLESDQSWVFMKYELEKVCQGNNGEWLARDTAMQYSQASPNDNNQTASSNWIC